MESLANSGARVPGTRRCLIDVERLTEIGAELREALPNDVREATEILRQKESLLNQATLEAQRIRGAAEGEARSVRADAERESQAKVEESKVVREAMQQAEVMATNAQRSAQQVIEEARRRAQRIVDEADAVAASRRDGADQYAREVLFNLEERLADILSQVRKGIDVLGVEAGAVG